MKDLQTSSGWMLCLIAAFLMPQFAMVSASYSMEETCAYCPDKTYIVDPQNCQSFGYCVGGSLVGTSLCPAGHLFNPRNGYCDLAENVQCRAGTLKTMCQNAAPKTFLPHPTNCSMYCYCENQNSAAECTSCPRLQVYDMKQERCVWNSTVPTCAANSVCYLVPNAKFVGNPNSCGDYLLCSEGAGTPDSCPYPTYFNSKTGQCEYNNPCGPSTPQNAGLGVEQPLKDDPSKCNGVKTNFVSDGVTCMGYYVCTPDLLGKWQKCPMGLHFNNNECVTPLNYACPYDRCGNINQEFVGAINTECKNYSLCKNQTSVYKANSNGNYVGVPCKNGYFNEFTGSCQLTSPASANYKLCLPVIPPPPGGDPVPPQAGKTNNDKLLFVF